VHKSSLLPLQLHCSAHYSSLACVLDLQKRALPFLDRTMPWSFNNFIGFCEPNFKIFH
jgi:hypothetical protein